MKATRSAKNSKLLLVCVAAIFFIVLSLQVIKTKSVSTDNYIQPTVEYKPEDYNTHKLKVNGTFENLDINNYISYNVNDLNAKLSGIGEKGMSFNTPRSKISVNIRQLDGRDFRELIIGLSKDRYTNKLIFPHYKKLIGNKNWDVIEYNSEGTGIYYLLEGNKNYIEVVLGYLDYEQRKNAIAETEKFISTVDFK